VRPDFRAPWRRDLALTLALLALLLLWEASRWDLVLAGWYGTAAGFALRDAWWTRQLLHDGGRALGWAALAACAWFAWSGGIRRRERFYWLALVLAGLLLVPALKRVSETSCPYELARFGGHVPYLPHWPWSGADGGPGHCFPSGHAVAAFAFLPLYFQWRGERPRLARSVLLAVLTAGALFGWAQLARGAHFPSHSLWSAWLCWVIGVAGAQRARSSFAADPPLRVTAAVARRGDAVRDRAAR
jgi:membrane-associated PAP2 superfamily phosphatase